MLAAPSCAGCTGAMFEEAGLKPHQKLIGGSSKTLSFMKPAPDSS